ncbi:MAG: hydantoinase B/oxoprolinase family protein, partial [Dehalococcoidia bacterium]
QENQTGVITKVDPVLTEIIRNALTSIADEAGVTMEKSAMSAVIRDGKDCCCVLTDAEGNLCVSSNFAQPLFIGTLQFTVRAVIERMGKESFRPGDIYLVNDPYIAGTHNNDVRVSRPIFVGDELVAFITIVGHWTDVGGTVPGTFYLKANEAYQEGVRIPPVLLSRDGKINEALLTLLFANIRMPDESRGDLLAMVAGVNTGTERFLELVEKYGVEAIKAVMDDYQDHGERLLRDIVADLPDGRYEWEEHIDQDPISPQKEPKRMKLTVMIAGDQITYDFTGTDPVASGPVNCTLPSTHSIALVGTKMIFNELPYNHGVMRAMRLIIPENSLLNPPFPSPVSGMAACALEKGASLFLGAFSKIVPERTMACCGNIANLTWAGWDERGRRRRYRVAYSWEEVGWGGRPNSDGLQGVQSYIAAGVLNIPLEVIEHKTPIVVQEIGFLRDSAGAGKFRGGCAIHRLFESEFEAVVSCLGDRERFAPWGLFGGEGSITQGVILNRGAPEERNLGMFFANEPVKVWDTFDFICAGGGGYGDPLEREPERVLEDVLQEYVSPEQAREKYGVVLKEVPETRFTQTYLLDQEGTEKLREELREQRRENP